LNFTGTGNSFNSAHRVVLALIMDSLRYWVEEMHVDGFRFDLATTLARNASHAFDRKRGLPLRAAPGPGAVAGEAHRRALGRRRRRLPARQLSARLGGMERQVPRLGALLLERRRRRDRRGRLAAFG